MSTFSLFALALIVAVGAGSVVLYAVLRSAGRYGEQPDEQDRRFK